MRNLAQYPITLSEKLTLLDRLIADVEKELQFGDNRLAILLAIRRDIVAHNPD